MSALTRSSSSSELLATIRESHDEAYLYISQGISYEEQEQHELAHDMYRKGLEKIEKALGLGADTTGPEGEKAKILQAKMRSCRDILIGRISRSTSRMDTAPPYLPPELPPSYDEACGLQTPVAYQQLNSDAMTTKNGQPPDANAPEVVELFSIPGEVQLFFVSYDGSVSAHDAQTSLCVYQFVEDGEGVRPPAWLQIGTWTYPLVPGQSPALESGYGAFLFPNVGAGRDSAVGVILPPSVTPEQRAVFLDILNQLTALREEPRFGRPSFPTPAEPQAAPSSFSETLSRGIVTGAEYVSQGLVKGAAISSDLIKKGASKAREKIRPEAQPVSIDPRVRDGLKIAHNATGVALRATGFLVKKLGDLTLALGKQVAPHFREQSTKLLASAFKRDPRDAQGAVDGVLTVAAGGLQGFSTIYMALENAARTLAYSLSSETVNIVGHKYGNQAGEVVGNALFSVGNLALTAHNVNSLGPKAVAKRTAKDAGKAVLKDYVEQVNGEKK